jgi:6-phosphogluconolactonase
VRSLFRRPLHFLLTAVVALSSTVASAADPLVFVSGYGPEIISYSLDASGKLTEVARAPGGSNPSFLAWSPDHKNLYAVNEGSGSGKVLSFAIDAASGKLTKTGEGSMGEAGSACFVSVHSSGKWVFTASYGSGHVTVMPVKADGSIGDAVDVQLAGKNAHMARTDKSGTVLFVPTLGLDQVQVYRFDVAAGKLTKATSIPLAKGAGPRHFALSDDEKHLYVINELNSSITTFAADLAKLAFTDIGTVPTLPADFTGKNSCAHIVIAPDGKTLYGSNRGHNSLVICRIGADGKLTVVGHETAGGEINTPRNFSLTPDGTLALVASQKGDVVSVLKVDPATGLMTKVGTQKVGTGPSFVGVMTR